MTTTTILKGRDGFQGDTDIPFTEKGANWVIRLHTSKSSRGGIRTSATCGKTETSGNGFSGFTFMIFGDFSKTVAQSDSRCTEKSVTLLHTAALATADAIKAQAIDFYAAKAEKEAPV